MHKVIKACLREIFGDVADEIPVLYGGSVNPGNANELIVQPSIDGCLREEQHGRRQFDKLIRRLQKGKHYEANVKNVKK